MSRTEVIYRVLESPELDWVEMSEDDQRFLASVAWNYGLM
jgi:hypothetical protein